MENNQDSFSPEGKLKLKLSAVIAAAALIITASLLAYAVFVWQDQKLGKMSELEQQVAVLESRLKQETAKDAEDAGSETKEEDEKNEEEPVVLTGQIKLAKIQVDWEDEPIKVADCREGSNCYLVGRIKNADPVYNRKPFYLEITDGMGMEINHYIIEQGDDGVQKRLYTEDYENNISVPIAGISDIPDTIVMPDNGKELKKDSVGDLFVEKDAKVLFVHKTLGNIYLLSNSCVAAELPDHTVVGYNFVLPFVSREKTTLDITFNDKSKNTEEYDYNNLQCGGICRYLAIEEGEIKMEDLEQVGTAPDGTNFYKLKNREAKQLRDLYLDKNTEAYFDENYQNLEKSKYTYDQFIALNPYLFWQDPLGRWIRFTNKKFAFMAEMCKPVVYLYPEKKTRLDIKVDVNGALTYAEPEYEGVWRVEASPAGKITDLATGKIYDSLLWEGFGLNYPKQESGWVVAKEDLGAFFDDKLRQLGLNSKERSDFKEYWLPRLSEKPFYKISFLTRSQFDGIASVSFSPNKPDTFIRVMMTAKGLDAYEKITEQKLVKTPERNGFTAVEWGGALLN
jgi:hypothetical protein